MATAAPVDVVALVKASVKSSGPSMRESFVMPRSITRSAIDAPSEGAVKVSVPVSALYETSGLAFAAAAIAAVMDA